MYCYTVFNSLSFVCAFILFRVPESFHLPVRLIRSPLLRGLFFARIPAFRLERMCTLRAPAYPIYSVFQKPPNWLLLRMNRLLTFSHIAALTLCVASNVHSHGHVESSAQVSPSLIGLRQICNENSRTEIRVHGRTIAAFTDYRAERII